MSRLNPNDFHGKYENYVETGTYSYGEYFKSISYPRLVLEKADTSHVRKGLGKFFYSNYRNELPQTNSRRSAFKKAEKLIEGELRYGNFLKQYNGEKGLLEAVKKAVSAGFVTNFRIEEPWHPSVFFDKDRIYTFPHQHKSVVLYTGQARHIFFSKPGKWDLLRDDKDANNLYGVSSNEDLIDEISKEAGKSKEELWNEIRKIGKEMEKRYDTSIPTGAAINELAIQYDVLVDYRNPESVITQGALYTGNQHVSDRSEEEYDKDNEKAVWLGFLDKAKQFPAWDEGKRETKNHEKLYDESIVLEAEVPTNWLAIKDTPNVSHGRIKDTKDFLEEYGSPKSMSSRLDRNDEFVIPEKTGRLPLHFIKSVWDKEEFPGTPHFIPKENFVGSMKKRFPKRMPGGKTHVQGKNSNSEELEKIKNQFRKFEDIRDLASKLSETSENAYHSLIKLENCVEKLRSLKKDLEEIEEKENEYIKKKEELQEKRKQIKQRINQENHSSKTKQKYQKIVNQVRQVNKKIENLDERRKRNRREASVELDTLEERTELLASDLNGDFSVNNTTAYLRNEFEKSGLDPVINQITLEQFIRKKSEQNNGVLDKIAVTILERHKEVASAIDQGNTTKAEQIRQQLISDLKKFSKNLYTVKCGPRKLSDVLIDDDFNQEISKKIDDHIRKSWRLD